MKLLFVVLVAHYLVANTQANPYQECPENCKWCDTKTKSCLQCHPEYFTASKICHKCPQGCKHCSGPRYTDCYDLLPGFRQDHKGYIESCSIEGCNYCNFREKDKCRGCNLGYLAIFEEDKQFTFCEKCKQEVCEHCDEDLEKCIRCQTGYVPNSDGICIETKMHSKCKHIDRYGFCKDCEYHNTTRQLKFSYQLKKCVYCPKKCESCLTAGTCEFCSEGYKWNDYYNDCIECKVPNC